MVYQVLGFPSEPLTYMDSEPTAKSGIILALGKKTNAEKGAVVPGRGVPVALATYCFSGRRVLTFWGNL